MYCGEEIRKKCRLGATSNYTTNFIIIVLSGDDNDDGISFVSISTECSASAEFESDMVCLLHSESVNKVCMGGHPITWGSCGNRRGGSISINII